MADQQLHREARGVRKNRISIGRLGRERGSHLAELVLCPPPSGDKVLTSQEMPFCTG